MNVSTKYHIIGAGWIVVSIEGRPFTLKADGSKTPFTMDELEDFHFNSRRISQQAAMELLATPKPKAEEREPTERCEEDGFDEKKN